MSYFRLRGVINMGEKKPASSAFFSAAGESGGGGFMVALAYVLATVAWIFAELALLFFVDIASLAVRLAAAAVLAVCYLIALLSTHAFHLRRKARRNSARSFLALLLCTSTLAALLLHTAPPAKAAGLDWSEAYREFLYNEEFLTRSDANAGYFGEVSVCVYDLDADGMPELFLSNEADMARWAWYVYTYRNGEIVYLGNCGGRTAIPHYAPDTGFNGVFTTIAQQDNFTSFYEYLQNGKMISQRVSERQYLAETGDDEELFRTDNAELYLAFLLAANYELRTYTLEEIRAVPWEDFLLEAAGIDLRTVPQEREAVPFTRRFLAPVAAADANAIPISTAQELWNIRDNLTGSYVLVNDIDLSAFNGGAWEDIGEWSANNSEAGEFSGTLDGQGYVITGLNALSGLFYLNLGTIKNLGIGDAVIFGQSNVQNIEDYAISGGICAANLGTIENCWVSGSITAMTRVDVGGITGCNEGDIRSCYFDGSISAQQSITSLGGIAGSNAHGARIAGCETKGMFTLAAGEFAGERQSARTTLGGIAGGSDGEITDCASAAALTLNVLYAPNAPEMIGVTGGIVGQSRGDSRTARCLFSGSIYSVGAAAGVSGMALGGSRISQCVVTAEFITGLGEEMTAGVWNTEEDIFGESLSFQGEMTAEDNYVLENSTGGQSGYEAIVLRQATSEELYTSIGWDFQRTWCFAPGSDYPQLIKYSVNHGAAYLYEPTYRPPTDFQSSAEKAAAVRGEKEAQKVFRSIVSALSDEERASTETAHVLAGIAEIASRSAAAEELDAGAQIGRAELARAAETSQQLNSELAHIAQEGAVTLGRTLRSYAQFETADTRRAELRFRADTAQAGVDRLVIKAPFASLALRADGLNYDGTLTLEDLAAPEEPEANPLQYWAAFAFPAWAVLWLLVWLASRRRLRLWLLLVPLSLMITANALTLMLTPAAPVAAPQELSLRVALSGELDGVLSVPVDERTGTLENLVIVDGDNNVMLSYYNELTHTLDARIDESGTYTIRESTADFSDLEEKSEVMREAILALASKGLMDGASETRFAPDDEITRAEFVSSVLQMLKLLDIGAENMFADVDASDWYYTVAASAGESELVFGTGDGSFAGGEIIPKDQMVVLSARALVKEMNYQYPSEPAPLLESYADSDLLAGWTRADIALATREDMVHRRADGLFGPAESMTRGDAAIILYRLYLKIW